MTCNAGCVCIAFIGFPCMIVAYRFPCINFDCVFWFLSCCNCFVVLVYISLFVVLFSFCVTLHPFFVSVLYYSTSVFLFRFCVALHRFSRSKMLIVITIHFLTSFFDHLTCSYIMFSIFSELIITLHNIGFNMLCLFLYAYWLFSVYNI